MVPLRERLKQEIDNYHHLEERLADPQTTKDPRVFKDLSREHARAAPRVEKFQHHLTLLDRYDEAKAILADPKADTELHAMAKEEFASLEAEITADREAIEILLLPPDPNSGKPVIVEIRAGTGGEEAALFAGDLYRMYSRFAEKKRYAIDLLSSSQTELGGVKEVVFSLEGPSAYDLFHREGGTHRVQRIPVTESGGRIHTSAVTVAVLVEPEEEEIVIDDKDLQVDTFRAGGAGGQHINKTDSAVRLTHIPSGIVVSCQDERSQLKNRNKAMKVLRARLGERQAQARHAAEAAAKKEQVGSGDRSERIRTYNFPQGRVTDHRIGFTAYNLADFMEGSIEELLTALWRAEREDKMTAINR